MNTRNELNERQEVLPGFPAPEHEYFDRATAEDVEKGLICFECQEPLELNTPYTAVRLFDSPYDEVGHLEAFHVENGDGNYNPCIDKLTDIGWASFRYFECVACGRIIIRQCPSKGWHSYVRETEDGEVCLRCWEKDIYENGLPREKFEEGQIPGMFYNRRDLESHGFEQVPGFDNFPITSGFRARAFCDAAIRVLDEGCLVAVDYERMAIGGLEGYVSMWAKKKGSRDFKAVSHQADGKEGRP